jgi:hypothetical protein
MFLLLFFFFLHAHESIFQICHAEMTRYAEQDETVSSRLNCFVHEPTTLEPYRRRRQVHTDAKLKSQYRLPPEKLICRVLVLDKLTRPSI